MKLPLSSGHERILGELVEGKAHVREVGNHDPEGYTRKQLVKRATVRVDADHARVSLPTGTIILPVTSNEVLLLHQLGIVTCDKYGAGSLSTKGNLTHFGHRFTLNPNWINLVRAHLKRLT